MVVVTQVCRRAQTNNMAFGTWSTMLDSVGRKSEEGNTSAQFGCLDTLLDDEKLLYAEFPGF
jgi:hypothetical protein